MHFICLRRKFRVAAFNRIFFAWNITTNLFRRVDGGLLFHNAHCSRDAIKLRISRWFLLRDRFASFISLFSVLHLFTIRARLGRRKRVVCYNVFSLFGRPGRSRPLDGNISRNRNMHELRVMHTRRQEEKIAAVRSIALEATTRRIYHVSIYTEINPAWIT